MDFLEERTMLARRNDQQESPSNCIGTALYLTRERDEDTSVCLWEAYPHHLSRMPQISSPVEGCIVAWHKAETVVHCAVVTHVNPLKVTHRNGYGGPIQTEQPVQKIQREFTHASLRYYLPRALAQEP